MRRRRRDPAGARWATAAALRRLATATADFRDQYYGLVPHVADAGDGAPLVTSGLLDVGRCAWGERPARFARRSFAAPRVPVDALPPALQAWAAGRLVPKVLVATQTPRRRSGRRPDGGGCRRSR